MNTQEILDSAIRFTWEYGPKFLMAVALLIGGLWLIRRLTRGFEHFLQNRKVDEGLRPFFTSLADVSMKVALILMVASTIGIATTSFIAIFSAVAFSVGLALQGSLGNFASGVLILLFRPFKVGDQLRVGGLTGKVVEIQIFSTILKSATGNRIIIPNGKITEGPIENIVEHSEVTVELAMLVHSGTNMQQLQAAADEAAKKCPHVLPGKAASVKVAGITRDDMKVLIGVTVLGQHYEDTTHDLYEYLRDALTAAGVELAKERRKETV